MYLTNINKTIYIIGAVLAIIGTSLLFFTPASAVEPDCNGDAAGTAYCLTQNNESMYADDAPKNCGGASTSIIECDSEDGEGAIFDLLNLVISIMTAGVGILAVIGIVYAGVLWASAKDSSDQVKKAKNIIFNVVIGLIMFFFLYAITNFLIPGGVFG
ncbi:hypothetical protein FJZ39_04180 [Candidatus Saccharibacteria bacterium]|nr:hypothetical protein [Candidatus Saccharibacteria bacterium]